MNTDRILPVIGNGDVYLFAGLVISKFQRSPGCGFGIILKNRKRIARIIKNSNIPRAINADLRIIRVAAVDFFRIRIGHHPCKINIRCMFMHDIRAGSHLILPGPEFIFPAYRKNTAETDIIEKFICHVPVGIVDQIRIFRKIKQLTENIQR